MDNDSQDGDSDSGAGVIWFDGIVEGRREDDAHLRQLVRQLNAVGLVHMDIDFDGGSFSLLADDTTIPLATTDDGRRQAFSERLAACLAWASAQGPVESTLRCTEIRGDTAHEALFTVLDGRMRVVARSRPAQAEDHRRAQGGETAVSPTLWRGDLRLTATVLALLLLVAGVVVWQSGMIHQALAADAAALDRSGGDFEDLLAIAVAQRWGRYTVTLTRGPAYPTTVEAVDALLAEAATTARRAAVNAVANGQEVYCRLLDARGELIANGGVSLRSLLADPKAEATLTLPGHMYAAGIVLTLDLGRRTER